MTYQAKYTESSWSKGFSSFEGALYKHHEGRPHLTRKLRHTYDRAFAAINNTVEFKSTLRHGPYIFPGGYEMHFVFSDGRACCFNCAREEFCNIIESMIGDYDYGWKVIATEINWEDTTLYCEHCGERIMSVYGDDEEEEDINKTAEGGWADISNYYGDEGSL